MRKRAISVCLLSVLAFVAIPAMSSTPPVVVGTFGAWAPAAFATTPGDTVQLKSADVDHTFKTTVEMCVGDLGSRVPCSIGIPSGLPPSLDTVSFRIHSQAPRGAHQFTCLLHPWMVGVVVVN